MSTTSSEPVRLRAIHRQFVLWVAVLLLSASQALAHKSEDPEPVTLSSKVLQFHPDRPDRIQAGRLVWRGGIEVTSPDRDIGGFSGLLISDDGARMLAVSDKGRWLEARLGYDGEGRLIGIENGRIGYLHDLKGGSVKTGPWRDAEDLAQLDDGSILVSFEHKHRIWRYTSGDEPLKTAALAWPAPKGLADAPENSGLEALVELADGGLLALTENYQAARGKVGFLWQDGDWSHLTYLPETGFRPTSATRMPGSDDILVLERRAHLLSGFHVRLVRVAAADIRPGAELRGAELARWGLPFTIDNFEALAARRRANGKIMVYLLSDDNFSLLQRTLLVMFELTE